jgi:enoyl-CoA hydratase/carnithine racemase
MDRKLVNYVLEDRIAVITIDNPPVNSLATQVIYEFSDVFEV